MPIITIALAKLPDEAFPYLIFELLADLQIPTSCHVEIKKMINQAQIQYKIGS